MTTAPTPKQSPLERGKDWYPYYAGFSTGFVEAALARHFAQAASLVDPWNGSGTTTAAAASRGLTCVGLDINPAVTVIARARLTPTTIKDSLESIAHEIVLAARRDAPPARECEPLERWLKRPAVKTLREIQRGINVVLVGDPRLELDLASAPASRVASLPTLAAFYYAALFATVRDLLTPFRASNPTWLRYPGTHRNRICPSTDLVIQIFLGRVQYLADRLRVTSDTMAARATLRTSSALALAGNGNGKYDACFSSPPYATRVDYVRGTLAELSVLGLSHDQIDKLRSVTTGTPTVRGTGRHNLRLMSPTANAIVSQVGAHASHGSATYYQPWIRNYFADLEASLDRICRVVKAKGRIGLVVQDSHYKAIHIDLQAIVTDTMQTLGRTLHCREDFEVRHSLAKLNPAARQHLANRTNHESLLVYV